MAVTARGPPTAGMGTSQPSAALAAANPLIPLSLSLSPTAATALSATALAAAATTAAAIAVVAAVWRVVAAACSRPTPDVPPD